MGVQAWERKLQEGRSDWSERDQEKSFEACLDPPRLLLWPKAYSLAAGHTCGANARHDRCTTSKYGTCLL